MVSCHPSLQSKYGSFNQRGWSFCEIMDQAGVRFHKPGQQPRLLFPVEVGQDLTISKKYDPLRA